MSRCNDTGLPTNPYRHRQRICAFLQWLKKVEEYRLTVQENNPFRLSAETDFIWRQGRNSCEKYVMTPGFAETVAPALTQCAYEINIFIYTQII